MTAYFGVFLADSLIRGYDLSWIWKFQTHFVKYNLGLGTWHRYESDWWTWPMMLRPIWYFFERMPDGSHPIRGIFCIGNPLIFWLIPVVSGYSMYRVFKERSWILGLLVFGFLCQWLPWALITRVKFFHYFYTAMPFLTILFGALAEKTWNLGKPGKCLTALYLCLVLVMYIYWYPLLTGTPISESFYRSHLWLSSWV
jgi:dolichyl-phosphate-mannose--protein O-mannosyl transferase